MEYRLKRFRGKWAVVWSENGATCRRSLRTADEDEAKRRFADWKRDAQRVGDTVADIFAAYLKELEPKALSIEPVKAAWKAAGPFFGHFYPDQIDRDKCREYADKRRAAGRKDGTIIKELGTVRAALRWQKKNTPAVFELPSRPQPRRRALTRPEADALEDACKAPHVRLFVTLALATAGRASALLQLKWSRVDFDTGLVDLGGGLQRGKGRAVVPMTTSLRIALEEARKGARTDYVIEYAERPVLSVKRGFAQACARAGLKDVSPHVLRHTAAVWMAEGGISMPEIAQFLGHEDSRITERVYARFSPTFLQKAAMALERRR